MRDDDDYGFSYDDDDHAGRNPAFIGFLVKLCGVALALAVVLSLLGA